MLDRFMKSQGIRRAALMHDMLCAVHRIQVSHDMRELDDLDDEQLAMLLVAVEATPEHDLWPYAEARLGPLMA